MDIIPLTLPAQQRVMDQAFAVESDMCRDPGQQGEGEEVYKGESDGEV